MQANNNKIKNAQIHVSLHKLMQANNNKIKNAQIHVK